MGISVNLDGVEAWGASAAPAILPPGWHDVQIESAEDGSSSSNNPQVALQMSTFAGEHVGYGVRDWLTLTPAALGRIRQFLEAVGVEIPSGDFEFPTSKLPGCKVRVLVKEEPKNDGSGDMRTVVAAYVPISGDAPQAAPAPSGASKVDQDIPF